MLFQTLLPLILINAFSLNSSPTMKNFNSLPESYLCKISENASLQAAPTCVVRVLLNRISILSCEMKEFYFSNLV